MDISFETSYLRYVVGTDGMNKSFEDKQTRKNYLNPDPAVPSYFMTITPQGNGKPVHSKCLQYQEAKSNLHVDFETPGLWATLHVEHNPSDLYLTFELTELSDPGVDSIEFGPLFLLTNEIGLTLANARTSDFAGALLALNLCTRTDCWPNPKGALLRAGADRSVGLVGAKFAMFGCPPDQILALVALIEKDNKPPLPYPLLDGIWAKESPEVKTSYLFVDLTISNYTEIIDYATQGGFRYIMVRDWIWNSGDYSVNTTYFPDGPTDLKMVSTAVHQAGLKLGMHGDGMFIGKSSSWVNPLPEKGILMYPGLERELAKDIYPGDTSIPTTTSPITPSIDYQCGYLPPGVQSEGTRYTELRGYHLRIEDEIIPYTDLSSSGFTTPPVKSPHPAGTKINNFAEYFISPYVYYLPDPTDPFYDKMVNKLAEAIEMFTFDMIYPDGLGEPLLINPWPVGLLPSWYLANLMVSKLYKAVQEAVQQRPFLYVRTPQCCHLPTPDQTDPTGMKVKYACTDYPWHVLSRSNTIDYLKPENLNGAQVTTALIIKHFDGIRLPGASYAKRDLDPIEFGWIGFFGGDHPLKGCDSTRPREINYAWAKAPAYGAAMSLETTYDALKSNGRTAEILCIISQWEKVRLSIYFSETVREQLKTPQQEFILEGTSGKDWKVLPVKYENNGDNGSPNNWTFVGTDSWTFDNPYDEQPVFISIDASIAPVSIINPTISLNGNSLTFMVHLEPGWYLEYSATGVLQVFDKNGLTQPATPPVGSQLLARQGPNEVKFSSVGPFNPAFRITLGTQGKPLN